MHTCKPTIKQYMYTKWSYRQFKEWRSKENVILYRTLRKTGRRNADFWKENIPAKKIAITKSLK